MAKEARLVVTPADWCPEAADMLERAKGCASITDLKIQVLTGARLFKVIDEVGKTVGYYILRIDQDAQGYEGVLVAAAGRAEVDLTAIVVPLAESQCTGCYSFRIHTARAGLSKKLVQMGYEGAELVMRKKLK